MHSKKEIINIIIVTDTRCFAFKVMSISLTLPSYSLEQVQGKMFVRENFVIYIKLDPQSQKMVSFNGKGSVPYYY